MAQNKNNIELEIILVLIKNNVHLRKIARTLKESHSTILRKLRSLEKENVVDYKEEGKNKTYFLKKTIEAKNYVFSAESYKLNQILKKYSSLRTIIEKIQKDDRIKLAILFGSYAKGISKTESDIDVYIETENINIKKELNSVNTKLSIKIGRYNKSNLLIKEIEKNHVILKGVELYYEKNKIFD